VGISWGGKLAACFAAQRPHTVESLILVAPSRSLGEFRELLSKHVKDRLKHEVHKDLIKTPPHELWEMVESAVKSILVQT
jgi:protein required for attachment to host cells